MDAGRAARWHPVAGGRLVGGWTDGDPDTITAAQAAIHTAARGLLADLENHHNEHGDQQGEEQGDEQGGEQRDDEDVPA